MSLRYHIHEATIEGVTTYSLCKGLLPCLGGPPRHLGTFYSMDRVYEHLDEINSKREYNIQYPKDREQDRVRRCARYVMSYAGDQKFDCILISGKHTEHETFVNGIRIKWK